MTQQIANPTEERSVAFVPFGAQDAITLSAKMVQRFIAVPTKSGKLPEERDCIKFVMLCKAKRLNPFEGDAFLIGYDSKDGPKFSLITAHQAFLKRAEASPEFDGFESGVSVTDKDGAFIEREGDFMFDGEKLVGAWSRVHFKNRKVPMFKRVSRKTFDTGYSRWAIDPAGMLVKCAEADGLRSAFPTLLGGLLVEQEIQHVKQVNEEITRTAVPMPTALPEPAGSPATGSDAPTPEPQPEGAGATAKPATAAAPAAPEGALSFTGVIVGVNKGPGKAPWSIITQDGPKFQTFDAGLATNAEGFGAGGEPVVIVYEVVTKGNYTNNMIVSITKP